MENQGAFGGKHFDKPWDFAAWWGNRDGLNLRGEKEREDKLSQLTDVLRESMCRRERNDLKTIQNR